jgi:hypothetical protein
LLVLNTFSAHKKKKDDGEKQAKEDFVAELKKLNTTISIVPSRATGYIQVCDGFPNKKIKELISEREEIHYDLHKDE